MREYGSSHTSSETAPERKTRLFERRQSRLSFGRHPLVRHLVQEFVCEELSDGVRTLLQVEGYERGVEFFHSSFQRHAFEPRREVRSVFAIRDEADPDSLQGGEEDCGRTKLSIVEIPSQRADPGTHYPRRIRQRCHSTRRIVSLY